MNVSQTSGSTFREDQPLGQAVSERVARVLRNRRLTLSEVSRETRRRFGGMQHYSVPHNFYYDLGLPGYSPRIEQALALSSVTNYRLVDWLTIFGFHLDEIPRLQAEFPSARTSFLDLTNYDRNAWIGWFQDVARNSDPPSVAPLGQLLAPAAPRRVDSLLAEGPSPFLYAKIGWQDNYAFPELLPGSIVRVDTRAIGQLSQSTLNNKDSARPYLVEYDRGLVCCRLHTRTTGRITLRTAALPFAELDLRLNSEARILGAVDWELRPLNGPSPDVSNSSMKFPKPQPLPVAGTPPILPRFLERARSVSGLSFRQASAKSRWVAETVGDPRYFCAPGSLTIYESRPELPGHIHKIISLCVLYSVGFWELLRATGLETGDVGRDPIPDELVGRTRLDYREPSDSLLVTDKQLGFLTPLLQDFEEVPFPLRRSLSSLVGIADLTLRDLFWTGRRLDSLHPYLRGAVFVAVNRRVKRPTALRRKYQWEQPLYVLLLRNGTYLLTGCSLEGSTLIVHPFADGLAGPRMLRNGVDVEVVGRVTALLRWLR